MVANACIQSVSCQCFLHLGMVKKKCRKMLAKGQKELGSLLQDAEQQESFLLALKEVFYISSFLSSRIIVMWNGSDMEAFLLIKELWKMVTLIWKGKLLTGHGGQSKTVAGIPTLPHNSLVRLSQTAWRKHSILGVSHFIFPFSSSKRLPCLQT